MNTRQYVIMEIAEMDSVPTTTILSTRSIVNGIIGIMPQETSMIEMSIQK
jgi:hypothetical protein